MDQSNDGASGTHDLDQSIEHEPESKHGKGGQAANEGEQAGPNSDESGRPIAPQTGDPRAPDRKPN